MAYIACSALKFMIVFPTRCAQLRADSVPLLKPRGFIMSASVIKNALKTTALAAVVMAGLQGASFAKEQPSQITPDSASAGSVSVKKPGASVDASAVKLAAWHHHLEINKSCDDPSLGLGCGDGDA